MNFSNQIFYINRNQGDKVLLNGHYKFLIEYERSREKYKYGDNVEYYDCKLSYNVANILYNADVPDVIGLIDMLIEATYYGPPEEVDATVYDEEILDLGSMYTSVNTIFKYKDCTFFLFGRYLYGYDETYVEFDTKYSTSESDVDENSTGESDKEEEEPKMSEDSIVLPESRENFGEYNYAFSILDDSNVLVAWGLYR